MDLKSKYAISNEHLKRLETVYDGYKRLHENPDDCVPMLHINVMGQTGVPGYTYKKAFDDPYLMLESRIKAYQAHLEVGDDCVPTCRVEFGTAQFAAAFGCDLAMPTDAAPVASSHPIKTTEDIYKITKPSLSAALFGKLEEFTKVYVDNLPEGMFVQHPDIQSPFNTAHLVRGNDILMDLYDDPDAVKYLLDVITDYMIEQVPRFKAMFKGPFDGWFFDWGSMWKGIARISNCSTHLISPETYFDFVYPRDLRFFESIGGGRMHYCGTYPKVIEHFFKNPYICGLDFDHAYHSVWSLESIVPKNIVLFQDFDLHGEEGKRIMNGELPKKRNLILGTYVNSVEEGREVYKKFKSIYSK